MQLPLAGATPRRSDREFKARGQFDADQVLSAKYQAGFLIGDHGTCVHERGQLILFELCRGQQRGNKSRIVTNRFAESTTLLYVADSFDLFIVDEK